MTEREALKLAREEIRGLNGDPYYSERFTDVIQKIDEALAQPEKHEWVGLTDEEFTRVQQETPYTQFMTASEYAMQCQIKHEARLKDKNT